MKNFILTLAIALGTMASFAQSQPLTVFNSYSSTISVYVGIVNTGTCGFAGVTTTETIAPGGFFTFPVGSTANEWYGITATAPGALGSLGPQVSVRSANKCLYSCPTNPDISNGLTALWDGNNNCSSVSVQ